MIVIHLSRNFNAKKKKKKSINFLKILGRIVTISNAKRNSCYWLCFSMRGEQFLVVLFVFFLVDFMICIYGLLENTVVKQNVSILPVSYLTASLLADQIQLTGLKLNCEHQLSKSLVLGKVIFI